MGDEELARLWRYKVDCINNRYLFSFIKKYINYMISLYDRKLKPEISDYQISSQNADDSPDSVLIFN